MQTPLLETWCSVRNSCRVSGGAVGAKGREVILATDRHPETNIKRSQIAFAVTSIENLGARLLGLHTQSLIESPKRRGLSLSSFLSLSRTLTHVCRHTNTYMHTHTHTHTHKYTHTRNDSSITQRLGSDSMSGVCVWRVCVCTCVRVCVCV